MYKYIDKIKSPKDLKQIPASNLSELCGEIRDMLINTVSERGGHLASNLGAVELTVALHRVLDAPKDKIIWDVGHQSYVHKILTGRANELNTLRKLNGICGFCNPIESEYDVSFTGHASASLSTALGFAAAKSITGEDYNVAAVIGDGAFTGGLAYEALNNIGENKTKMLIILNDNAMSIEKNVGAFSKFLAHARTNPNYTASKKKIEDTLNNFPYGGESIMKVLYGVKKKIKSLVAPNLFFEQIGITYLGPVDGHNIADMEDLFRRAVKMNEPVLVHVITKKGKGYRPAEKMPQLYHGVSSFEKEKGVSQKKGESFSSVFGNKICEIAMREKKVAVITPAMIPGSGLGEFASRFPDRLYDVGIAEGHAVSFAAGLANAGIIPVVAIYSTFLQRGYDNVIHDVAIGNYHVVFAVDRAGLVSGDGATHQGLFDIGFLASVPNMTILSPSSYSELEKMLDYAVFEHNGPIAVRYPRGFEKIGIDNGKFELSKATVIRVGSDITLVCEGQSVSKAVEAATILETKGIGAEIIDVRTVKPMDFETVFKSAAKTKRLLTIEQGYRIGGMGEMIAAEAKIRNCDFAVEIHAVGDEFVTHGDLCELNEKYGFSSAKIAEIVERMLEN